MQEDDPMDPGKPFEEHRGLRGGEEYLESLSNTRETQERRRN